MAVFSAELRREILRRARGGERTRYPRDLKVKVAACVREARRRGFGWAEISARLGVAVYCLRRWSQGSGGKFRKVEVVAERVENRPSAGAVVVLASGVRVEGLDVAGVVSLLRLLS